MISRVPVRVLYGRSCPKWLPSHTPSQGPTLRGGPLATLQHYGVWEARRLVCPWGASPPSLPGAPYLRPKEMPTTSPLSRDALRPSHGERHIPLYSRDVPSLCPREGCVPSILIEELCTSTCFATKSIHSK